MILLHGRNLVETAQSEKTAPLYGKGWGKLGKK
jgi:hypothetical protein